jgi:hypothetical protein
MWLQHAVALPADFLILARKVMVAPFVLLKGANLHVLVPDAKSAATNNLWRNPDYADIGVLVPRAA